MNASDFKDLNDHPSLYKGDFTPDAEQALARVRARTYASESKPPAIERSLTTRRWLSAVAAVVLLLTTGYLIFSGDGSMEFNNTSTVPMAIDLPDGTVVLLQQGGTLSYGGDYNDIDRHIFLDGQAYFEVAKDDRRTFWVNTSEAELRVTGTAFNLRIEGDEMEVEVSEGTVELHRAGEVLPVTAKQCGVAKPGKNCTLMEAHNLNRHAWRTGKLTFQGTRFADAIKTICNNYDLVVAFPTDCDFPVSGNFSGQDPVAILETIVQMDGGKLQDDGNGYYQLMGMRCGQ